MTDDSLELHPPPLIFHPRQPANSMHPVQPAILSFLQQAKTSAARTKMVRENQLYLGSHPEIKAIISLLLRNIFLRRPPDVAKFVAAFVKRKEFSEQVLLFIIGSFKSGRPTEDRNADLLMSSSVEAETKASLQKLLSEFDGSDSWGRLGSILSRHRWSITSRWQNSSESGSRIAAESRSKTSARNFSAEDLATIHEPVIQEEGSSSGSWEGEEDGDSDDFDFDDDNDRALMEGHKLIMAMFGRTPTFNATNDDLGESSMSTMGYKQPLRVIASALHTKPASQDDVSKAYSTYDLDKDDHLSVIDDVSTKEEEEEEYFD